MNLAFCGTTALRVLRACRSGMIGGSVSLEERTDLMPPTPGNGRVRFTPSLLDGLSIGGWAVPRDRALEVAVPSRGRRVQMEGLSSTVFASSIPSASFISLGDGFQLSCPELLFIEMAQVMPFTNLLLFGYELCGSYSRDPLDPHDGSVSYWVPPATSIEQIGSYLERCHNLRGMSAAREALEFICDNAWSPMEALVAALASIPPEMLGYGLGPLTLNKRVPVSEASNAAENRIPDIVFGDGNAGLNYDGGGHLDLGSIASAAFETASRPYEGGAAEVLESAVDSVRRKYVDDRRRDRELVASGHPTLVVTHEDLVERRGLDRVMSLVMDMLEQGGENKLARQRTALDTNLLVRERQDLIWSMLPGVIGVNARKRMIRRRHEQERRRSVIQVDYQLI